MPWYRELRHRAGTIFGVDFRGPPEPENHRTPLAARAAPDPAGPLVENPTV